MVDSCSSSETVGAVTVQVTVPRVEEQESVSSLLYVYSYRTHWMIFTTKETNGKWFTPVNQKPGHLLDHSHNSDWSHIKNLENIYIWTSGQAVMLEEQ